MKILFTRDLNTADSLIQFLAHRHEVCVLSIRARELQKHMRGVRIMPVSERPRWIAAASKLFNSETVPPVYLSSFYKSVREFRPDVLILMESNRFDLLQALHYKRQNPECRLVVWTETKRLPRRFPTRTVMRLLLWILRKNLDRFSHVITYTHDGKVFWEAQVNGQVPVTVIPAAADIESFYPDQNKVWMPKGVLRVIMNARFVSYKRHQDVVKALALLRDEGFRFALTLIGSDIERRPAIEEMIRNERLSACTSFLNPVLQGKLREIYVKHDVLILPSYNEALGLVVPEAMASGLPTITSDTVGANVYVKEGETGYIFKTCDAEALADRIRRISNPSVLSKIGRAARVRIENGFTTAVLGTKLETVLTGLV